MTHSRLFKSGFSLQFSLVFVNVPTTPGSRFWGGVFTAATGFPCVWKSHTSDQPEMALEGSSPLNQNIFLCVRKENDNWVQPVPAQLFRSLTVYFQTRSRAVAAISLN